MKLVVKAGLFDWCDDRIVGLVSYLRSLKASRIVEHRIILAIVLEVSVLSIF